MDVVRYQDSRPLVNQFGTNNQDPDRDIMARMVEGHPQALEVLYDRHSRQVYALLYRMVGDRQSAEDVLQEAFLRAWDHASTYRESEGKVLSWLFGIAHHLALNELRRRRRRPQTARAKEDTEGENDFYRIPTDELGPADQAWESIRKERVNLAMAELSESEQSMINLYAAGHSQSEIASRLSEPLGTVKSRMRRGFHQLRDILAAEGIGLD